MNALTNKIAEFSISKLGWGVRKAASLFVHGSFGASVIPLADQPTVEKGLVSGGMAVVAILYGCYEKWVDNQRKRIEAQRLATALDEHPASNKIGDESYAQFTARTGIPVRRALPV